MPHILLTEKQVTNLFKTGSLVAYILTETRPQPDWLFYDASSHACGVS
jgi:hypothetical protein